MTEPKEELALVRTNEPALDLTQVQRLGNILAASGYFADAREMAQAAVKVMAGQELGIAPIASMMGINVIKGKVALGVHLIASRVRAHGYDFRFVRHDNTGCVIEFQGKLEGGKRRVLGESSFTEEDARAAQVFGDMYKKYPRNMYYSRAMSNGAKWYTPEIFGGAPVYTPEELGAAVDDQGEMVHPEPINTAGIDTGGHPVGTKAASDYVRDKKLAEPKKDAPRATEAPVDPDIQQVWQRMGTSISGVCAVFAEMKKSCEELSGSDKEYYAILTKHGFAHANDVKTLGIQKARVCAAELFGYLKKCAAALEPPADEDKSDWVPDNIASPVPVGVD